MTAYGPAYIGEGTKEQEKIVGLQTDKPLKRASKLTKCLVKSI